jgi:hypothetical protein
MGPIRLRGFYTNQTCMGIGDFGTRPKNAKLGWFLPENRQFVLFSDVGYNAERFLTL